MKRKIVSVWEVNQYVNRLIAEDYTLNDIWIQGEVSNCKYHHSGHIYFTIKDTKASIQSVMFSRDAMRLAFKLEEGMKIYARIKISIYEKTGNYQAYVYDIEKQGRGILYERFERLKAQLEAEGLFDLQYKKELPRYPKAVGIITSSTGAAIQDIIQVAARRNSAIPLVVYKASVQGELAVPELIKAIKIANKENKVDIIILGRGGGSIEDLWAFNEEEVARAIFNSKIPIISAVGHEVDFTISDFVSDKRAATPSAAAELVIPAKSECIEMITAYKKTLNMRMQTKINLSKRHLESLITRPVITNKSYFYKVKMQAIDQYSKRIGDAYRLVLLNKNKQYELAVANLERLSPLATLQRGYSLVNNKDKLIKSIHEVDIGDELSITVKDGKFKAKVCKKE